LMQKREICLTPCWEGEGTIRLSLHGGAFTIWFHYSEVKLLAIPHNWDQGVTNDQFNKK
jgi:hypothetical protein